MSELWATLDWGSPAHWYDWCQERALPDRRVKPYPDPPADLYELAVAEFGGKPRVYAGRDRPKSEIPADILNTEYGREGFCFPPHRHPHHDSRSAVHYLTDHRVPLTMWDEQDEPHLFVPEQGQTLVFRNVVRHASEFNPGPGDKLFIVVVGGYP